MAKLSEKIGYGFGDMSSSMFWKIFTYYLPFFYSEIFGLTLGEAAMLLLVTKLWMPFSTRSWESSPTVPSHVSASIVLICCG